MSEADKQTLRDQYAATNERDFARVMSYYAEDVVLTIPPGGMYLNSGTFSGRDQVGEFFGDWFRSFGSDLRFEITELSELEDGSILVVADNTASGRASGIALEGQVIWTYWMRDGKIVRMLGTESRDEAIAAAAERASGS